MRQGMLCAFALVLMAPVTACGFQPLYAGGAASGNIKVEQIDGRAGHALRKALLQELAPGLPGLEEDATLTIVLSEGLRRLALQPDEAASRTDVSGRADYVLATGTTAISGRISAETSYNVPTEPFADITAQIDANERVMTVLARRLVDDMRLKLAAEE